MVIRRRFACLFPVLVFIALRALAHANPVPLPWSSGVFDGQGLDDVLQTIRVPYARSDVQHVWRTMLPRRAGLVVDSKPGLVRQAWLATAHPRAPPGT